MPDSFASNVPQGWTPIWYMTEAVSIGNRNPLLLRQVYGKEGKNNTAPQRYSSCSLVSGITELLSSTFHQPSPQSWGCRRDLDKGEGWCTGLCLVFSSYRSQIPQRPSSPAIFTQDNGDLSPGLKKWNVSSSSIQGYNPIPPLHFAYGHPTIHPFHVSSAPSPSLILQPFLHRLSFFMHTATWWYLSSQWLHLSWIFNCEMKKAWCKKKKKNKNNVGFWNQVKLDSNSAWQR